MATADLYNKACDAVERANYDYAVELFREVLRQDPEYPDARVALRGTERRRVQERGSQLGALALLPFKGLLTALKAGLSKPPKRLEVYEDMLKDYPDSFFALFGAGKAAYEAGHPGEGAMMLRDAQRLKPNNKAVLRLLANVLAEQGEPRDALKFLERLLQMSPNNRDLQKEVRDLQATGHMAQHKMDQAESFRDLIRDKDKADELEKASRLEVSQEDYSKRVQKAMAELKERPDDPLKVIALAKAFIDAKDVGRARQLLKQKYKEMPENYDIREMLGDIQMRLYDEAMAPLAKQAEGGDADAEAKLAELKEKRRQFASREYQWRMEQHPTDASVQMDYAKTLFEDGQYNQSISIFQELTRDPRLGMEASRMLGLAFTEKGQYDLAVEQFERALMMHSAMDNRGKELRYSQAESYEKMGRPDEALAIYKKIYSQDINFRDVSQKVETLSAQTTS